MANFLKEPTYIVYIWMNDKHKNIFHCSRWVVLFGRVSWRIYKIYSKSDKIPDSGKWLIYSIHYNVPFKTIKTTHFSPFQATLSIYVCLFLFEELTTTMILSGVAAQISHLFLLQNFPFFNLTSPSFLAGLFENVSFIQ